MNSILIALSLIRVPKLFASLLLWPLIIGVIVAGTQVMMSIAFFDLVSETPRQFEKRITSDQAGNKWVRRTLFGTAEELPPIQICRWVIKNGIESPPDESCQIERHEVVIRTDSPADYDATDIKEYFDGATRKLHLCTSCKTNIIVHKENDQISSDVFGISALGVYILSDTLGTSRATSHYVSARIMAREQLEHLKSVSGTVYLHPPGFEFPINITQATKIMILIMNTALIAVITLWLSLKGHRKVLDYFARNGALLPLVAACGKNTFYNSLWIITLIRVAFFLVAVLPSTILVYARTIPKETMDIFIGETPDFILWLMGMTAGLASLAIIASIAELKQRHSIVSFLYRYVPVFLAFAGTALWFVCIFHSEGLPYYAHKIIASLPVIGISPILLSPLFPLGSTTVALHSLFASALVLVVLRLNSRWFAAHLEEI